MNSDTKVSATDAVGALYIYWNNTSGAAKGLVLEEEEEYNELDPE